MFSKSNYKFFNSGIKGKVIEFFLIICTFYLFCIELKYFHFSLRLIIHAGVSRFNNRIIKSIHRSDFALKLLTNCLYCLIVLSMTNSACIDCDFRLWRSEYGSHFLKNGDVVCAKEEMYTTAQLQL